MRLALTGMNTWSINKKLGILCLIGWNAVAGSLTITRSHCRNDVGLLVEGKDNFEKAYKIVEAHEGHDDGRLFFGATVIDELWAKDGSTCVPMVDSETIPQPVALIKGLESLIKKWNRQTFQGLKGCAKELKEFLDSNTKQEVDMKQTMDSIRAVVRAHNALDKQTSDLVDVFNDVLAEHCDFRNSDEDSCEGNTTCNHGNNELSNCCMAYCPLDK